MDSAAAEDSHKDKGSHYHRKGDAYGIGCMQKNFFSDPGAQRSEHDVSETTPGMIGERTLPACGRDGSAHGGAMPASQNRRAKDRKGEDEKTIFHR